MIHTYLIWNGSPEIYSFGSFALRWYGLLFATGFLLSQQILYHIFKKEGKPTSDVDILTIYMVVATVLGARLGHVIFYQTDLLWTNPLAVILPFEFNPFRFTGLLGLASHGGAFGILFALWLYSRKKKPGQNYLQILDRIVIVVALTGALIRLGNFFNSEIIGKPYDGPTSVVFINQATELIEKDPGAGIVQSVTVRKDTKLPAQANARVPIDFYIFFKPGVKENEARSFLYLNVKRALMSSTEFVDEPYSTGLQYSFSKDNDGNFGAKVHTLGIARHPAQLYESISCVFLFLLLYWIWSLRKTNTPDGQIFAIFLIICWTLRFAYEFLKENQAPFENGMSLNMGQILSIPLILTGIFVLIRSLRTPTTPSSPDPMG